MPVPPRILIVDGDRRFAHALSQRVDAWGYDSEIALGADAALACLADPQGRPQVVITEIQLPAASGSSGEPGGDTLLRRLGVVAPGVVPVVLTGYGTIAGAVAAMKLGVTDYLTKPLVDDALQEAVAAAVARHTLLSGAAQDPEDQGDAEAVVAPRGMVGRGPEMAALYQSIAAAAEGTTPVLVTGEPGTGKDLVARAVHAGRRAQAGGPLVVWAPDVGSAGPGLGDLWAKAAQGTLLVRGLDGLGPEHQAGLLAQLRADADNPADVRLVATAQREVDTTLPRPLLDRVAGVRLAVPALRDRPQDLNALADHFLKRACSRARRERSLGPATRRALAQHAWPGNLRELARAIEHAVTLSCSTVIEPEDLPPAVAGAPDPMALDSPAVGDPAAMIPALADGWTPTRLADALLAPERRILRAALEAHGWNRNAAARDLGIDRTTLYKKIKRFGLDRPDAAA